MEKLCECGCNKPTNLATRTRVDIGSVRGLPTRFLPGHYMKRISETKAIAEGWYKPNLSGGFCMCGCGGLAPIASKSRKYRGDLKGYAVRFISGHNKGNWRGGITPDNIKIRGSKEYTEWRSKVFIRDNRTCQTCGQYRGKIEAHHLMPFSKYEDLRMILSNGITLCDKCHDKTYAMGDFEAPEDFLRAFRRLALQAGLSD